MVPDPSTITKMCDVPDQKSCGFACSSEQKKINSCAVCDFYHSECVPNTKQKNRRPSNTNLFSTVL